LFGSKAEDPGSGQRPDYVDHLLALPVAELAALILPLWAASADFPVERLQQGDYVPNQIASWLAGSKPTGGYTSKNPFAHPLDRPITEAIQALEHAGLLVRTFSAERGSNLHLTRLGEQAIARGPASYLGVGPTDRL
jgi:hypothetical protein